LYGILSSFPAIQQSVSIYIIPTAWLIYNLIRRFSQEFFYGVLGHTIGSTNPKASDLPGSYQLIGTVPANAQDRRQLLYLVSKAEVFFICRLFRHKNLP
jgi:hypothetical protein